MGRESMQRSMHVHGPASLLLDTSCNKGDRLLQVSARRSQEAACKLLAGALLEHSDEYVALWQDQSK